MFLLMKTALDVTASVVAIRNVVISAEGWFSTTAQGKVKSSTNGNNVNELNPGERCAGRAAFRSGNRVGMERQRNQERSDRPRSGRTPPLKAAFLFLCYN